MFIRSQKLCDIVTINLPHKISVSAKFPQSLVVLMIDTNAGDGVETSGWEVINARDIQMSTSRAIAFFSMPVTYWTGIPPGTPVVLRGVAVTDTTILATSAIISILCLGCILWRHRAMKLQKGT
jgi:hypothetical protein